MEKLSMCRICLVENVRMYVVANENLQETYEKLTDIPFVTVDCRPMLVCFFCYAKLKQCYQLLRKCLEAEEVFAQMLKENYEYKPLIKQGQFSGGFIITSTVHINIFDKCQIEICNRTELPVVHEKQYDVELEEEHQSDELESEYLDDIYSDRENKPHLIKPDSDDDVPLMKFQTEVVKEQEVYKKKRKAEKSKSPPVGKKSKLNIRKAKLEDGITAKQKEVLSDTKIRTTKNHTSKSVTNFEEPPIEKKSKLDIRKAKLENAITAKQKEDLLSDMKIIRAIKKHTAKTVTKFEEPVTITIAKGNNSIIKNSKDNIKEVINKLNRAIDTNCHNNINKQDFSCKMWNNKDNNNDINRRQSLHTSKKLYKCVKCQQSFTQMIRLKLHNIREHTGKNKCVKCQRGFDKPYDLKRHLSGRTCEKPYKCEICQRGCSTEANLIRHMRIHTDEHSYKCDVCQSTFRRKSMLSRHVLTHTRPKPYKCNICPRSFNSTPGLKYHILVHTGVKPYKCDICKRGFIGKSYFNRHMRTHTGEKPYKCDMCQSSFGQKSILINHIRIHTGEKPYKCDVCQQKFSQYANFKAHSRTHTGEKPYKCEICQHNFGRPGDLKRHILCVHSREKPYKCDICQRSFNHNTKLKYHMRTFIHS